MSPRAFASVGGAVCFVLADVAAPATPLEVRIESPLKAGAVVGRKRMYAAADRTLTVNVAPYVRSILATTPFSGSYRVAPVRIVVSGAGVATYTSPYVTLAGGREDLPVDTILSAGAEDVAVRAGDTDELALVTTAVVQPEIVFTRNGKTYVDTSMNSVVSKEMVAVKVDVSECLAKITALSGVPLGYIDRFAVRLRLTSGGISTTVERRYSVDTSTGRGMRVAWVNRYGAVDFHTFPVVERQTVRPGDAFCTILSEPVDAAGAERLAEILDAPAVWQAAFGALAELEVADGAVVVSPTKPTYVALDVKPRK